MVRYCIWLAVVYLLACGHAEAIEERNLCWEGVCAGMTLPRVESRLEARGFNVHDSWLSRWIQRGLPQITGAFEYERYIERVTANRGAKCDPVPIRQRHPCASMDLQFVRFPSGRRRLISLSGTESLPTKRLASSIIADLQKALGPPDKAEWKKWPDERLGQKQWTLWEGSWEGKHVGSWLLVKINLLEEANVKEGTLLPPNLGDAVHASSIHYAFHALWIGREAEVAWEGEKAGWIKDPRTGCRLWNNYPKETDSVTWNGRCINGYASGYGVARWSASGREYELDEGEFRNGKLNGHAVITVKGALIFDGAFRDNLPDGPGTLKRNGETYSGIWSKGCFNKGGRKTAFFTDRDKCDNF